VLFRSPPFFLIRRGVGYFQCCAGCAKRPSGKAAGESKPEAYPLGYGEDLDEPRTKLADFFIILKGGSRGDLK
jgi:hypothetical protein